MLSILLVSALLFIFAYGIGKAVVLATRMGGGLLSTDIILIGVAGLNTLFAGLSLFMPVGLTAFLIVTALVLILVLLCGPGRFKLPWSGIRSTHWMYFLPFLFLVCLLAADGPRNGDSGLYHIQSIKWIEQFAVVPGLGNLHGRFAFNPNVFVLMAGFSFAELGRYSLYAFNAFFSLVFFYYLLDRILNGANYPSGVRLFYVVTGMLSVPFMLLRLSSPTPDLIAGLLPVYIFLRYIDFNAVKLERTEKDKLSLLFLLAVLAVYVVTTKLSSLFILLLPAFAAWEYRKWITGRWLMVTIGCGVLIVAPWLIRNYYLSGYMVYPFNGLDVFHPDWKIPEWLVIREKTMVYEWARWPSLEATNVSAMTMSQWIPKWYACQHIFWKFFLVLCFLSPLVVLIMFRYQREKPFSKYAFRLWVASFAAVLFWFLTAPDPRFGYPFILTAALTGLLFLDFQVKPLVARALTAGFILVLFALPLKNMIELRQSLPAMLVHPLPPDHYATYIGTYDPIVYDAKPMGPGVVRFPIKEDRCYDQPLPCVPAFSPAVQLRGQTLGEGFFTRE
jgi:hypothetical protein